MNQHQISKIVILLLAYSYTLQAQSQFTTLSGKVVDENTLEPVPFAHVFIEGTQVGTTTNLYGNFALSIPNKYSPDQLLVTCLGYKSAFFILGQGTNEAYLIKLTQDVVQLQEVVVKPESAKNLIKEAWARIPHNYDTTDNILHGYYKMTSVMDDKTARYTEAFLNINKPALKSVREKKKLQRDSIELKQMRLKPTEVKDWKVKDMIDWENNPYVLNHRDLIREFWAQKDSLKGFFSRFKVKIEQMVLINSRRTYEIRISPKKENRKTYWYGSIFLDEKTKAFVKLNFEPSPRLLKNMRSSFGYKVQSKLYNVFYDDGHFQETVLYELINDKWYLKEVQASKRFLISSKKREMDKVPVFVDLYYITDSVSSDTKQAKNAEILPYRSQGYWEAERFMERRYDSTFWKEFDLAHDQPTIKEDPLDISELGRRTRGYTFTKLDTLQGTLTPLRTSFDVCFYHLEVEVLPEEEIIKGSSLIRFKVIRPTNRIQIDLFAGLTVEKIMRNGERLNFVREYNAIYIDFPKKLKKDDIDEINVFYYGRPVDYNPAIPMYASFLWLEDDSGNPWIQAICQGYGASGWWPNKDHLSDKPDSVKISVTVPKGLDVISNGRLVAKNEIKNNRMRFDWTTSYPINNYNIALNIGKYKRTKDEYDNGFAKLNLDYYTLEESPTNVSITTDIVKPMLKTFEKLFGPYPFSNDGFKLVESPHPMEHQSCVSIGSDYFYNADESGIWSELSVDDINYAIVLHESAHEWWGNSLSCIDNAELWLHEAFATYAEVLFVEDHYGYAASQEYLNRMKSRVRNQTTVIGKFNVNHIHYEIGDMYTKGALMLNTFRKVMDDDDLWFSILKGLQIEFKYQSITTLGLINFINKVTKTDYSYFFDQYLKSTSIPKIEIKYERIEDEVYFNYRWVTTFDNFIMPITYAIADGDWEKLYPTNQWKHLQISKEDVGQVKVNTEQFYVDVSIR